MEYEAPQDSEPTAGRRVARRRRGPRFPWVLIVSLLGLSFTSMPNSSDLGGKPATAQSMAFSVIAFAAWMIAIGVVLPVWFWLRDVAKHRGTAIPTMRWWQYLLLPLLAVPLFGSFVPVGDERLPSGISLVVLTLFGLLVAFTIYGALGSTMLR